MNLLIIAYASQAYPDTHGSWKRTAERWWLQVGWYARLGCCTCAGPVGRGGCDGHGGWTMKVSLRDGFLAEVATGTIALFSGVSAKLLLNPASKLSASKLSAPYPASITRPNGAVP